MTMGPIRAIAVFSRVGETMPSPRSRRSPTAPRLLVAGAFLVAILMGTGALGAWGVASPC
jgi:small neutral amino acid transporter SnatA (MarC family)